VLDEEGEVGDIATFVDVNTQLYKDYIYSVYAYRDADNLQSSEAKLVVTNAPSFNIDSESMKAVNARRLWYYGGLHRTVYVADGKVYYKTSSDGIHWSLGEVASGTLTGCEYPALAITTSGYPVVVFKKGDDIYYAYKDNFGWHTPVKIDDRDGETNNLVYPPAIVSLADDTVLIVWQEEVETATKAPDNGKRIKSAKFRIGDSNYNYGKIVFQVLDGFSYVGVAKRYGVPYLVFQTADNRIHFYKCDPAAYYMYWRYLGEIGTGTRPYIARCGNSIYVTWVDGDRLKLRYYYGAWSREINLATLELPEVVWPVIVGVNDYKLWVVYVDIVNDMLGLRAIMVENGVVKRNDIVSILPGDYYEVYPSLSYTYLSASKYYLNFVYQLNGALYFKRYLFTEDGNELPKGKSGKEGSGSGLKFDVSMNSVIFSKDNAEFTYSIPTPSQVEVKLYRIDGREVKTLVSGRHDPGVYRISIPYDELNSGVYLVVVRMSNKEIQKKVLLLK